MAITQTVLTGSVWTQISDGTADVLIQTTQGTVGISDGATQPAADAPSLLLPQYQMLNVRAPSVVWARSADGVVVVVAS